jgi:hypothetical protein
MFHFVQEESYDNDDEDDADRVEEEQTSEDEDEDETPRFVSRTATGFTIMFSQQYQVPAAVTRTQQQQKQVVRPPSLRVIRKEQSNYPVFELLPNRRPVTFRSSYFSKCVFDTAVRKSGRRFCDVCKRFLEQEERILHCRDCDTDICNGCRPRFSSEN